MAYRLLRQDAVPDACAALYPEGVAIAKLCSGQHLLDGVNEPVRVYLASSGVVPTDFIERPFVVVSERLKSVLDAVGVDNVQYFRAQLQQELSNETLSGFWLANIIGRIACVDPLRSRYELVDGEPSALEAFSIDPARTLGMSIFRLAEDPRMIVISPRVQAALNAASLRRVLLQDPEAYDRGLPISTVAAIPSAPGGVS
ncbi:MAG TPA: DUF1629 domain-containing protein [Polyangiales bacterium]|nr:DUF1629 domain-containing protein [Polyangiales bacterium]